MEEGDVKDVEHQEKVLELWNRAVDKLRAFVLEEVLPSANASPEQHFEIKTLMGVNAMLYMPPVRDFLDNYYEKILAKDVDFFRVCFPPEFRAAEIPVPIQEKGVRFAKVFRSLLNDLENE